MTLKAGNLGNSSFLPKTTKICYKNVSNVSQNLGGQAVHFVRTNESCPGKTAEARRRKVAQDFSSTFLLRCLPSFFSREGFIRPFPSSTLKSNFCVLRAVLMGTKSCTKSLDFSIRFSRENLAVEDFVTLFMGKQSCSWGNVLFGHAFDKLIDALLCGVYTKFKLPNGNSNVFFPNKRGRFARAGKAVALQHHNQ